MPASPLPLLPSAVAEHTVESLYAMHGRRRPWIYWFALAGVGAALGALPLVPVDVTVRSAGMVRPATERLELKAPIGGRIAGVWATDNDRVEAGAPLLELSSRDAEERLERNRAIQREKTQLTADLAAMTSSLILADFSDDTGAGSTPSALTLKDPALSREYLQFLTQLATARLVFGKARVARDRISTLAANGIVTDQERDDARYAEARALADLHLVVQQALAAWQSQLRDEQIAGEQLRSDEKRLLEEVGLATVCSPAAGTVQGLIGLGSGSYVVAGQSLGFITPDDRLLVETLVASKDIGLIRIGQKVRLQIDAYPYTQWGLLNGVVESLAADATISGSQAAFRVMVRPTAKTLRLANGSTGTIRKGMTLTVRFALGRRTMFQVLYEDATRWLDPQGQSSPS